MENKEYTKMHKDYEGLKWIMKSISKEVDRHNLNHVFSLGKSVYATDGKRAHFYRMDDPLPKGSYKPIVDKKAIVLLPADVKPPDIMICIPKHKRPINVKLPSPNKRMDDGNALAYTSLVRALNSSVTLNYKYFSEMIGDSYFKASHSQDGLGPIVFRNGRKFGLIMPMKA